MEEDLIAAFMADEEHAEVTSEDMQPAKEQESAPGMQSSQESAKKGLAESAQDEHPLMAFYGIDPQSVKKPAAQEPMTEKSMGKKPAAAPPVRQSK